jgi:exodeoxyribonuclease V gamma subunit
LLFVHRSNRTEELSHALAEVTRRPLASPLEQEVVVVSSQGMSRWLAQDLAARLGVWANARFPFPRAFIDELLSTVGGSGDAAAWGRESLTWSIAALLPGIAENQGAEGIRSYLEGDEQGQKRFALAAQLANAFDQYAAYRPELVRAWERGAGRGFQPDLFRALSARLGDGHLAARAERFLANPLAPELPARLSLFGVSGLPRAYVRVLARLARGRDVHVFVLCASPSEEGSEHPLATSLGAMGREFEQLLAEEAADATRHDAFVEPKRKTMLDVVQSDLFGGKKRAAGSRDTPRITPRAGDESISVHACHSRMREVEVLQDQLFALFENDAALEPHDVIVMAPNIDEYAPLIDAVFGQKTTGRTAIPYRIADRSAVAWNASAEALLRTLSLVSGRMKASDVLDLVQLAPVQARFGIDAESLPELRRLVSDAGIRWGIDSRHRQSVGQRARHENTWQFGLERLLLGHALPEAAATDPYYGVVPIDVTTGDASELVGRLAEATRALFALQTSLAAPRPVPEWSRALHSVLDALVSGDEPHALGVRAVRDAIDALATQAETARFEGAIHRDALADLLREALDGERSARSFLTGGVTFCALLPMRAIPFDVVCILGLNDADFPRKERTAAFDLVRHQPEIGDRSSRKEDRQLFLEAVLSARKRLTLSFVGKDSHDNSVFPPSVVLAELLDLLDGTFSATHETPGQLPLLQPSADGFGRRVVVEHPLQAWSARYFDGRDERLFSYAKDQAEGARARATQGNPTRFHRGTLAHEKAAVVDLDQLVRFLENPARGLVQRRLGVLLEDEAQIVSDRQPIELLPLDRYMVGTRLLARALSGGSAEHGQEFARGLGLLPSGTPGDVDFTRVMTEVQPMQALVEEWLEGGRREPSAVHVDTPHGGVAGVLRELYPRGQVFVRFSRLKPKHELGAWVRHLALACADDVDEKTTVVIGRAEQGKEKDEFGPVVMRRFKPLQKAEAAAHLSRLLALYHLGQAAPLCLFPAASAVYAKKLAESADPRGSLDAARKAFAGNGKSFGADAEDAYVARIFENENPFGSPVPFDEDGTIGLPSFVTLADDVFGPLLAHLEDA